MNASILGLGTAVPASYVSQEHALNLMQEIFAFDDGRLAQLEKIYLNSGIKKRHTVLAEFKNFFKQTPHPGMTLRNDVYKSEAIKIAYEAVVQALKKWGGDPQTITHIISVSCTGVVIPGIEFSLMNLLNLKRSIYRLGINFMGCFGAFKGLEVAHAFAKENTKNRVLVVCTELCSLHLQPGPSADSLMANSIFADGAAAVIVGCEPSEKERPFWEIVKHSSFGLENSTEQMSWEARDHGLEMKLSTYVPISISRQIHSFSEELVAPYATLSESCWAIHPGGKAILQTIEKKLSLKKSQTQASWDTLESYGNMSSSTFLFVLDRLIELKDTSRWTAGLGFGPGLSVEGLLLKPCR